MDRPLPPGRVEPVEELARRLGRVDGRGYGAYREIEGAWRLEPGLILCLDHVQADPFAPPSAARLQAERSWADLPADLLAEDPVREVAVCDFLARAAAAVLGGAGGRRGLIVHGPGAEILPRSTVCLDAERLELRLGIALPAAGRRIRGAQAEILLREETARLARTALRAAGLDLGALRAHVEAVEDQRSLRAQLEGRGLVAFVADGAVLPRASGVSQRPLDAQRAVPFCSPESLRLRLEAPHAGAVEGMGLPAGVTLLCGGGFHGKSTLLEAVARCVYDHPPGDGRERCVTRADAVKLRAEQGRWVGGVDIRAFLGPLPGGGDTASFATANASGSTSQAAGLMEAIEAGSRLLLLDEDASASNLLYQDAPMRDFLDGGDEPIIHLHRRVRALAEQGVSTVLVLGGSGGYFAVADRVLQMRDFVCADATVRAREVVARHGLARPTPQPLPLPAPRVPDLGVIDPRQGRKARAVRLFGGELEVGRHRLDLRAVEQLVDAGQVRCLGWILAEMAADPRFVGSSLPEVLDLVEERLDDEGFLAFSRRPMGDLARPRRQDLAAAVARLRGLTFSARR